MSTIYNTHTQPRLLYGDLNPGTCSAGQPLCRCSWIEPQTKTCAYHNDPTGLIWQVHHARAEIYPSIGGWTLRYVYVCFCFEMDQINCLGLFGLTLLTL